MIVNHSVIISSVAIGIHDDDDDDADINFHYF